MILSVFLHNKLRFMLIGDLFIYYLSIAPKKSSNKGRYKNSTETNVKNLSIVQVMKRIRCLLRPHPHPPLQGRGGLESLAIKDFKKFK